jgi:hypothetical protein
MRTLIFVFLYLPIAVFAQMNEGDTLKTKAGLSLTGLYQGGNVETLIFRAKTDFSVKPYKNLVFKNQNSYVYQAFGKQKADEDILSLNFLYFNTHKKVRPFVLGFVSTNFRREIDLRSLVGAGASFEVLNKEDHWLKFAISSEYEQTRFAETDFNINEYDGRERINTPRGTLWVNGKYKLFKGKTVLTHESYYQPSLQKLNNYRWQANLGLAFPIWDFLSFKVDYRHTHESIVIASQERQDRFLTFGFEIKNF